MALAAPSVARADPPGGTAPIALDVAATDTPRRLRFGLRNVTNATVEVVADHTLLSFVQSAPAAIAGRRRGRRARSARCAFDQRPAMNEFSARVTLEAGQRYSEEVDVDDLCGLRTPLLGPEALEFHYGFAPPRRGAVTHSRSILSDDRAQTLAEITVMTPPSVLGAAGESPAVTPPPALLTLSASGSSAPTGSGLRSTVTLRNPSVQAAWTLLRPTQFSFVVLSPTGREVTCDALARQPAPQRDLFVRIPAGARRALSLLPAMHCPVGTFRDAGIYRARARFESRADGEAFGMQRVFTGIIESPSFPMRVSRGRVVPMSPRFE